MKQDIFNHQVGNRPSGESEVSTTYCGYPNRYAKNQGEIMVKTQKRQGVFKGTDKGYGFITPDDGEGRDWFVPARYTKDAWTGDHVEFIEDYSSFRPSAIITNILERAVTETVATVTDIDSSGIYLSSLNRGVPLLIMSAKEWKDANTGDVAKVKITSYENNSWKEEPNCSLVKKLGKQDDPGIDILAAAENAGISNEFPDEVLKEAEALPKEVLPGERRGRKDFRSLITVTIDGEHTKDFDDAVSVEKTEEGCRLYVHIADVAHYVKEGSALDREALKRGTSTYLPDRTMPMLPVQLSNGICSLNPKQDRLALSCVMDLDKNGKRTGMQLYESVIRSDERMTYTDVTAILEGDGQLQQKYAKELPSFRLMQELYEKLEMKRKNRGMISFTLPEAEFVLDDKGHTLDVVPKKQDLAMKMIEQFMLEANEAVAEKFRKEKIPFEYRIHELPDPMRLMRAKEAFADLGFALEQSGDKIRPMDFEKVAEEAKGTDAETGVGLISVRTMCRARYFPECKGHFGLAAKYYCHFTSPIRRYPDTQIHRIIHEYLEGTLTEERKTHYENILPDVCEQNSKAERKSMQAEMDADSIKKCEYLKDHIGETYAGTISGITKKSVFIMLDNTCEGRMALSEFGDAYEEDGNGTSATNLETGDRIFIGKHVDICIKSVDSVKQMTEFELIGNYRKEEAWAV